MTNSTFQLDVLKNENTCVFCLSWGDGERRFATVPYPAGLIQSYKDWQRVYLQFYRSRRGWTVGSGVVEIKAQTLESLLEEKRAALLDQFTTWLRDGALTEIRETIAQMAQPSKQGQRQQAPVDLLVACQPLELARLPWEQWSLITQTEQSAKRFRLLRTRLNSDHSRPSIPPQKRQRVRILVIIGKDNADGIDFQEDFEVMQKQLSGVAELKPVGWTPGQNITALKKQIAAAIADPVGWDVLFFAGHSNETKLTGGELAIAPDASLQLSEIQPELETAIQQGLQFAFFNSCSGLNIADALIDLGLNQVAVMREPIANTVAQKLLVKFLEHLAQYQDVQDALQSACQYLKSSEERFDYPSAYLIPSLYCQPQSTLFHIQRKGWKRVWKLWQPTLPEAIAVGSIAAFCLMYPIQDFLIERRLLVQAVYRNITQQVSIEIPPPVLMVSIDQESIKEAKLDALEISPIDRQYLGSIIQKVATLQPRVIGIDYFLEGSRPKDKALAQAVRQVVDQQHTWITFASLKNSIRGESGITDDVSSPNWSLQGYINMANWYVELLPNGVNCNQSCPFAYLLALVKTMDQSSATNNTPKPQLQSQTELRSQVASYLNQSSINDHDLAFIHQARLPALTQWSKGLNRSYKYIDQRWLQPIIDFSVPFYNAYDQISAKQLLDKSFDPAKYPHVRNQVVIIAPGGYRQAGIDTDTDNFPIPAAVAYWRQQQRVEKINLSEHFTGGEAHAYIVHHLLSHHLVVPIPDLWLVALAAILGKGSVVALGNQSWRQQRRLLLWAAIATLAYSLIGLQLYISVKILMPWFFPSLVLWFYFFPILRRQIKVTNL
ncbi:MAG: CHASE2 domain-containing protein (plasmid) [Leptolyngbya sp. BL-A-14]